MIYDWQTHCFIERDGSFLLADGGYFETIKIEQHKLKHKEAHLSRLKSGLRAKGSTTFPNFLHILEKVEAMLLDAPISEFNVLKFVYFPKTSEIYLQFRMLPYNEEDYVHGIKVNVAQKVRPLKEEYEYKTTNREEAIALREAAKQEGFYEVLYQTENNLLIEGTVSNLFMIKKGIIYTPPLNGILNGTMRSRLFQLVGEKMQEKNIVQSDLLSYDGCFITNALIGIMPIAELHWDNTIYSYDVAVVHAFKDEINKKDVTI